MSGEAPSRPTRRADVLVIGAGLSGLGLAGRLTERGVDVAVVEASEAQAEPPGVGLIETGPPGLFSRCVASLGARAASILHEFSRRNAELISTHPGAGAAGYHRAGSFHVTSEAAELAELLASARLLREHVPSAAAWDVIDDAGIVASRTGTEGFLGGVYRPEDAMLDARAFLVAAENEARARGARIARGVTALSLETGAASSLRAITDRGAPLEAEIVVVCAGAASVRLHGRLRDRIVPILGQGLSVAGLDAEASDAGLAPLSANFGHFTARRVVDVQGARLSAWSIPWSLRGSDPEGLLHEILPDQQTRIEAYLAARFRALRRPDGIRVERRRAAHVGWTMDSLPMAGPAPGQPRLVFCTGFSGHDWSLAFFVARVVADAILGDPTPEGFELFAPRRFLEG